MHVFCLASSRCWPQSVFAGLLAALLLADVSWGQFYDFELVNNGAVIVSNDEGNDTAFPSVIKVPDWVDPSERPDVNANYYMYYGNHSGDAIKMKWASSIDGAWTDYDFTAGTGPNESRGVFDVGTTRNDPTRNDYDHISAPDVIIDDANQRFVMYFHGDRDASSPAPVVHERFVTTSGSGLNFNDFESGNGEEFHGPVEAPVLTNEGLTRDVWIGDDYMKTFEKNGRFYGVGKRGIINAAPDTNGSSDPNAIWMPSANDPFGETWEREDTPESNWAALTFDPTTGEGQDDYHSPAASFLASQAFADHPNNPNGRRVFSNGNDERLNHVDVNLLSDDQLEVFFYVRQGRRSDPDDFNAIYRLLYDVSSDNVDDWTVVTDADGQAVFDVVVTPEDLRSAVEQALGTSNYDADFFADPISLGDTEIFIDDDGSKYLFFSYVSAENSGSQGEGQISVVRLLSTDLLGDVNLSGNVSFADIGPFILLLANNEYQAEADINMDSVVSFADIGPFIGILAVN